MKIQETPLPAFSARSKLVHVGGHYKHYKGNPYKVLAIGRHSETLEEFVVYQALYGEGDVWVRPLVMFLESVMIDGILQSRFTFISN